MNIKLGDVTEFINGGAWSDKEYTEQGVPVVKVTNLKNGTVDLSDVNYIPESSLDKYGRHMLRKGDLVIATVGSHPNLVASAAGRATIIPIHAEGSLLNQNALCIRSKSDKLYQGYLGYLGKSDTFQGYIKSLGRGAANQVRIALGLIKEFTFDLPPLPTQRKIASILSAYDDLIENNLKRIKLLEEKAFLRYKILMSSEKLIEGTVGDLVDVKSGFAFKGADWTDEGFPVIKIKNIGNNDIDLTDCSLIPENIAEAAAKFKLNAGDLLIAMTGATVGKIGMMPKTETSFYLNQRVGIFKPKVENVELFLFCFYNEPSAKDAVESLASGAAQPNISGGQLESIKLFYPKFETVTEFGNSIKSQFELIWNLKQQNAKLREARDILLPRLMSGEVEV